MRQLSIFKQGGLTMAKTPDWLTGVSTIVNIGREVKKDIFWSNDQSSGVTYKEAYIARDSKLGERYAKNITLDLKIFGPKGGPHENLQAAQRIKVNPDGAQLNIKKRWMDKDSRAVALSAINSAALADEAKKLAVACIYSGAVDFEIVISEGSWSLYDNIAGAASVPSHTPPAAPAQQFIPQNQNAQANSNPVPPVAPPVTPSIPQGVPANPFLKP